MTEEFRAGDKFEEPARAVSFEMGKSSEKGTPFVRVVCRMTREGGGTRTYDGYFTEKTAERTLEALETMGWTGDDFDHLPGLGSTEFLMVGEYERNEQNGKVYPKVNWINRIGRPVKNKLDQAGVAELKSSIGAYLVERKSKAKQKSALQSNAPDDDFGPEEYGDDIPF